MNEITIVIPTYNDEEYIRDAINSVLSQTNHDWELLIINDSSTDKTKEIIEGYENCFPNKIKVINSKKNNGVGISRKIGLDNCNTTYVTFLDSDDVLAQDYVEKCLNLAKQHDSDVVYTSFTIYYPKHNVKNVLNAGDYILNGEATPQSHFNSELKFLTGKVFKTELLKKIPWSKNRVGEDVQTLFFATYMADKVRTSSYSGYIHRFRENSLLADAPFFYCYCYSTMAELEIIDWLFENGDKKIYEYLLKATYINYQKALSIEKDDKKGIEKSGNHKGDDVNWRWDYIKKWFKDREHLYATISIN